MTNIYEANILDHYKHPRNFGRIENADIVFHDSNPLCGDDITITLKHDGKGKIVEAKQFTQGCAISQAGASILFEQLEGKKLHDALKLEKEIILEEFGELSVSRIKCALLALNTVKKALVEHENEHKRHSLGELHDARD